MPTPIQPAHFPPPRGYANGILSQGPLLHLAGQIGWELDGHFESDDLVFQFGRALDHVLDILYAAHCGPEHLVSMTIYVTDLEAYRQNLRPIGALWRQKMGRNFPAMALVGVAGLVEVRAKVEIQAVAECPVVLESR